MPVKSETTITSLSEWKSIDSQKWTMGQIVGDAAEVRIEFNFSDLLLSGEYIVRKAVFVGPENAIRALMIWDACSERVKIKEAEDDLNERRQRLAKNESSIAAF